MKKSVFAYFLLSAAAALLTGCSGNNGTPGGSGLVETTEIIVSVETSGQLKALYFGEGDNIDLDDTIGVIDTTTVVLMLRQTEAARAAAVTRIDAARLGIEQADLGRTLAAKDFERAEALLKTGSVNRQQYDQLKTARDGAVLAEKQARVALRAAEADLAGIEVQLARLQEQYSDCFPTAPISGVVTDKYLDTGELAGVGKPLIKIADLDTVWVKVYLPPDDLSAVKLGDRAEVDPEDGREQMLTGRITWISSEAEFTPKNVQTREARANLVYAVKVTMANPDQRLKIGMPVTVAIK